MQDHDNDIDYMTTAYRMLYEIETILKYNIQSTLFKKYGLEWEEYGILKKTLERMFFYEVLTLYQTNPLFIDYFSNNELTTLLNLKPIRNDIAHMQVITKKEYDLLMKCKVLVKNRKYIHKKKEQYASASLKASNGF